MPTTQAPTRDRILFTSAELFRRQGYAGTGLKQVTTQAEAPFGSLYHFWPGGKEQLAEEVLRTGGDFFLALYRAIVDPAPDLLTGVRDFFTGAGETLVATGYLDACPIATVAGEVASTHEPLRAASADVFELWTAALTADLAHAGALDVSPEQVVHAGDGCLSPDSCVSSVMVVAVEPAVKGRGAFVA